MKNLHAAAQEMGRRGGTARAKNLTPAQRSAIALMGANARIKKYGQKRRKKAA